MTAATHDHAPEAPVRIPEMDASPVRKVALIAAVFGLGAYVVLGIINATMAHDSTAGIRDFFLTYLVGLVFWMAIPIGATGLLMIGYLTSASWQTVLRRCFQASTRTLPLIAVLFIPIAVSLFIQDGKASPFWWSDKTWDFPVEEAANLHHVRPEAVEENQHKIHGYPAAPILTGLNPPYVIARVLIVLAVLGTLAYFLNTWARPVEERDDPAYKTKLVGLSGPGVIVWGLFGTCLVTDLIMSVEPTWASSMFPVVFGMNAFICTFCVSVLTFYALNADKPGVMAVVKDKFRIDIGTMILGFTMVWAYASFCQYMLIWAGNLPEELVYYTKRSRTGWEYLAYFLMAFHWLFPFIVLLFREVKTNPKTMKLMSILLLAVCAADVVWWIVPAVPHPEGGLYVPMAFAAVVGIGGVWGLVFAGQLAKRPILPQNKDTQFLATWGHGH